MDFLTGGIVNSVERIASEFIETDMESAEAKALMVKTLDPNGKMRRDLSRFNCVAYGFYLLMMSVLALMFSFDIGNAAQTEKALTMFTDIFTPVSTAFGVIVTASFGVNGVNAVKSNA